MKITEIKIIQSQNPVSLSTEYRPAWREPDGKPIQSFGFSFYEVHTDEGIVGVGPYSGEPDPFVRSALIGLNPFFTEKFWNACMVGRELTFNRGNYGGLEIALWDIVGKTVGKPIYQILGACRDKILAYAATNRLLNIEEHVKQVKHLQAMGFQAVKLRLHRPDPHEDLAVIRAVKDTVGDRIQILVDANQNNRSLSYKYWSRRTALWMARELDKLDVYFLEEPLAMRDLEGLVEIADSVDMFIAGGEHSANIYEFKEQILRGAYDILQPDVRLGDLGITGIRKIGIIADYFGRQVVPHVSSAGNVALGLPATLQAVATIGNCPMIEYPYDPPLLNENQQFILKEPIRVDNKGFLKIPDKPGIGVEIDYNRI